MSTEKRRFPHLGELSVAILENWVSKVVGETTINKAKEPLLQKRLQDSLEKALARTEQRFVNDLNDLEISDLILSLPISDLPSFREAIWGFAQRPTDHRLAMLLWSELTTYKFPKERLERATNTFIEILQEELIASVPEVRQVLSTLSDVRAQKDITRILQILERTAQETHVPANIAVSKHIISFHTLITDRTKDFVGRTFVFETIESFLRKKRSGYFVIQGDPGIGKTALLSQLVKEQNLIHHFNIVQQNIRSPEQFLENVCAQLMTRFDLPYPTIPPRQELVDSNFLMKCLEDAVEKNNQRPLLITIDSLDESNWRSLPNGVNVLYLPRDLPMSVYFIVTTLQDRDIPLDVMDRQDFHLKQDSDANKADIRRYIENYAKRERIVALLSQWQLGATTFIRSVAQKSQGNFMYLHYVLPALEDGTLIVNGVEQLPSGLRAYYQRRWKEMQSEIGGKLRKSHEQVISILAAIPEPVSLEAIAEWTKLPLDGVRDIVRAWEPFLFEDFTEGETRYRIYHTTFAEFIGQEIDLRIYKELVTAAIGTEIQRLREKLL